MRRAATLLLLTGAALVFTGAAPEEHDTMLEQFDRVLTAMSYAAAGLCRLRHRLGGIRPDGRGR